MVIYVIEQGDTVFNIAERFNASPEKIIEANGLTNLDNLVVGQSIVLPINVYAYEIKKGDTLYKLSQRFNVSIDAILNENPDISNADMLSIGQIVLIPVGVQPREFRQIFGKQIQKLFQILHMLVYLVMISMPMVR